MAGRAARAHSAPTTPERRPQAPERHTKQLDRLIHDRVRLGILSALAATPSMAFTDLRAALDVSDGNLSVHARKLEDAGYVVCTKGFDGRTPRTEYRLTPAGRRAFEKYLDHMESLIAASRQK